jgi:hypothetical protein
MFPGSRGSAGVAALILAAALLLCAVWLLTDPRGGSRNDSLDRAIDLLGVSRDPGLADPEARALLSRVDDLSKRLDQQVDSVPVDVRLVRGPRPGKDLSPPGVNGLTGGIEGSSIVLTWQATGDMPATGYRIERLSDADEVLGRVRVDPTVFRYRDDPVDSLRGRRKYRVSALGRDGTVVGLQQKTVPFRQGFGVDYLEARENGTARFRVNWERAGQRIAEEFDVAVGGMIGGPVPGKEDRPALDFGTGWRFAGFAGSRQVETREASVPRFTATGTLARDPETGRVIFEVRKMPVAGIVEGAEVETPREDGAAGRLWLQKAKDG